MRTWEDYKNHVKAVSEEERRNMEEIEEVSDIVFLHHPAETGTGHQPARPCRAMRHPTVLGSPYRNTEDNAKARYSRQAYAGPRPETPGGCSRLTKIKMK